MLETLGITGGLLALIDLVWRVSKGVFGPTPEDRFRKWGKKMDEAIYGGLIDAMRGRSDDVDVVHRFRLAFEEQVAIIVEQKVAQSGRRSIENCS